MLIVIYLEIFADQMRQANMLLSFLLCFFVVNIRFNIAENISAPETHNQSASVNATETVGNETKPVVQDSSTPSSINVTPTQAAPIVSDSENSSNSSTSHTPIAPASEVPLSSGDPTLHAEDEETHGIVEMEHELHYEMEDESDESTDHEDL